MNVFHFAETQTSPGMKEKSVCRSSSRVSNLKHFMGKKKILEAMSGFQPSAEAF